MCVHQTISLREAIEDVTGPIRRMTAKHMRMVFQFVRKKPHISEGELMDELLVYDQAEEDSKATYSYISPCGQSRPHVSHMCRCSW